MSDIYVKIGNLPSTSVANISDSSTMVLLEDGTLSTTVMNYNPTISTIELNEVNFQDGKISRNKLICTSLKKIKKKDSLVIEPHHCVVCKNEVPLNKPTASKDILKDFSLRSFKQFSELLAIVLKISHNDIKFTNTKICIKCSEILDKYDELQEQLKDVQFELNTIENNIHEQFKKLDENKRHFDGKSSKIKESSTDTQHVKNERYLNSFDERLQLLINNTVNDKLGEGLPESEINSHESNPVFIQTLKAGGENDMSLDEGKPNRKIEIYSTSFKYLNHHCPFCADKNFSNRQKLIEHFDSKHGNATVFECKLCDCIFTGGIQHFHEHRLSKHPELKQKKLNALKISVFDKDVLTNFESYMNKQLNKKEAGISKISEDLRDSVQTSLRKFKGTNSQSKKIAIELENNFSENTCESIDRSSCFSPHNSDNNVMPLLPNTAEEENSTHESKINSFIKDEILNTKIKETKISDLKSKSIKVRKFGIKKCAICKKSFSTNYFYEHMSAVHLKDRVFECDICLAKLNTPHRLYTHKRKVHFPGKSKKQEKAGPSIHELKKQKTNTVCTICQKTMRSYYLEEHMATVHLKNKIFKCKFCHETFTSPYHLKAHKSQSHYGSKKEPVLCSFCGQACRSESALQRHIRVHTGQRPYRCTICSKAFGDIGTVKKHIRKVHQLQVMGNNTCDYPIEIITSEL